MRVLTVLSALAFLLPISLAAQTTTGTIRGRVLDIIRGLQRAGFTGGWLP